MLTTALAASACGNDIHLTDFQPDPPSVYVAKVKNILVGLPPTADEIAAVEKDPKALGGLVDQWMAMPEYDAKMMVFFELAFQQTQITAADFIDMIPVQGLGIGRDVSPLVQNIRESFARTAVQLTSNGQPFTDAFTTHQLMMTPALMELYGFLDARQVDDNGNINDLWEKAAPTQAVTVQSTTPINVASSLTPGDPNFLNFYNPDLPNATNFPDAACNGNTSISAIIQPTGNTNNFTLSYTVHDILYGTIPLHRAAAGACPTSGSCPNGEACVSGTCMATCTERTTPSAAGIMMSASDFTTWKLVTIRPPQSGEKTTAFYNLPALRTATELVLSTPRPGFFSTPAFMANWPTNASNQARVTTNQALIVATGTAIDGTDGTNPGATPPGLDTQHAAPGSACYGCHQLLDPTRSIFTATYSYFYYPQTDAKLMAVPGMFAFQGVVAPMKNIDDFANLLASHPLVPQAWAQKLCYYVNSAPCDPADPEFQRVVAAFAKSGTAWNGLVKDIVTSPLTTNTVETQTAQLNGEVVAVSRRDHLCAALNNRLGFVDICQLDATLASTRNPSVIAQIVSGMPSDGYGRGSTIPVLPNDVTLFYRAGLENICEQVAMQVIDAKASAMQPGVKIWSSTDPTTAINDFVSIVMALVPSDPRTPLVTKELTDHFTAAQAQSGSATSALQSTFVAACLSPSFIGIGM